MTDNSEEIAHNVLVEQTNNFEDISSNIHDDVEIVSANEENI